jgi:hypothetical protein
MIRHPFSIPVFLLVVLALAIGCTSSSAVQGGGDESSRTYATNYKRAVETVAQAVQDVGLSLESTSSLTDSSYVINAVRVKRVAGASDPVPVAQLRVFVSKLSGTEVRVQIDQERMSRSYARGNTAGNSSIRKDYKERVFGELDDRLERPEQSPV